MRIEWFFIWSNLNPLHPTMLCAKFGWYGPAVLEKKILNFVNVFWNSLFRNYLPLEKGKALDLNKLESSSPKDALCQVWLKLAQRFWRNRFLNFVNVFLLFRNYLPLEKGGPFICTKLNPHHPRMHCAKFGWNLTYGSGEEDFLILSMYFDSLFGNYLSLVKGGPFFEQTWIPSTQGCFVPSLVEIDTVVLEKKIKMWKFTARRTTGEKLT